MGSEGSREMAQQGQWQGNKERKDSRPELNIKEVSVSDPKADKDKFEVEVTVGVYYGNRPAQNAEYQFWVGGKAVGVVDRVDPEGKATDKLVLDGNKPAIYISVVLENDRDSRRFLFVKKVPLPKLKKRLDILGTFEKKNAQDEVVALRIFLRRIGKDGKVEAGPVSAFDFIRVRGREEWQQCDWQMEAAGQSVCVELPAREDARTIEFFLPDDKDVKTSVSIPGKKKMPDDGGGKPFGFAAFIAEAASSFSKGKEIRKSSGSLSAALAKIKEETR